MFHMSIARQSHGKSWEVRCHLMVSDFSSRAFYTGGEESEGGEAGMWKVAHQQEVPGKFLVHRWAEVNSPRLCLSHEKERGTFPRRNKEKENRNACAIQ